MNGHAAGHHFTEGRCKCGVAWCDIRNSEFGDVGKPGIAHIGNVTHSEITTIHLLKAAEDVAISAASSSACCGWRRDA